MKSPLREPWGTPERDVMGNHFCITFESHVPACALFCCNALEQSSFSLESPPAASNRLSLENSAGGRETNKGWSGGEQWPIYSNKPERWSKAPPEHGMFWLNIYCCVILDSRRSPPQIINQCHLTFTAMLFTHAEWIQRADLSLMPHSYRLVLMVIDLFPTASSLLFHLSWALNFLLAC